MAPQSVPSRMNEVIAQGTETVTHLIHLVEEGSALTLQSPPAQITQVLTQTVKMINDLATLSEERRKLTLHSVEERIHALVSRTVTALFNPYPHVADVDALAKEWKALWGTEIDPVLRGTMWDALFALVRPSSSSTLPESSRPAEGTCAECQWWKGATALGSASQWGECHAHAPRENHAAPHARAAWPVTFGTQGCGEFRAFPLPVKEAPPQ